MLNKWLIWLGAIAIGAVFLLNVIPLFWGPNLNTYIRHEEVRGMAVVHNNLPFTLNFDQQKKVIDILNRAILVGDPKSESGDPLLGFQSIVIYRFNQPDVVITPIRWVHKNLLFRAKDWSESNLLDVSREELFTLLPTTYD